MVSHHHKCIFVHIPKTAGISIEKKFCEILELAYEDRAPLILGLNNRPKLGPPRLAHLELTDYIDCHYVSKELYEQYYKFTIVRNPIDRVFSAYKYRGYSYFCTFDKFVKYALERLVRDNWFFATQVSFLKDKNGDINMDFIGKFEDLNSDFKRICKSLKIKNSSLPHYNKTKTQVSFLKKMYRIYRLIKSDPEVLRITTLFPINKFNVSKKSRSKIYELYKEDFDKLGYNL